jgi:hypothetical protein
VALPAARGDRRRDRGGGKVVRVRGMKRELGKGRPRPVEAWSTGLGEARIVSERRRIFANKRAELILSRAADTITPGEVLTLHTLNAFALSKFACSVRYESKNRFGSDRCTI